MSAARARAKASTSIIPCRSAPTFSQWSAALDDACGKLEAYGPDVVLVSLGVDTFEKDPISKFKLTSADYPKIGARIAKLGLPTLFVMEGGYAVAEIGVNAVGVLDGFEEVELSVARLKSSPSPCEDASACPDQAPAAVTGLRRSHRTTRSGPARR